MFVSKVLFDVAHLVPSILIERKVDSGVILVDQGVPHSM